MFYLLNYKCLCLLILCQTFPLLALSASSNIGVVIKASGQVVIERNNGERLQAKRRFKILEGDIVQTAANSTIQIRFIDKAMLALRENSQIHIQQYHTKSAVQEEKVFMKLISGGFRTITGNFGKSSEKGYEVATPVGSIGIRGTNYEVMVTKENMALAVWSGAVVIKNNVGQLTLGNQSAYNFAVVNKNMRPKGVLVAPEQLTKKVSRSSHNTVKKNQSQSTNDTDKESKSKTEPKSEQGSKSNTDDQPQSKSGKTTDNETATNANNKTNVVQITNKKEPVYDNISEVTADINNDQSLPDNQLNTMQSDPSLPLDDNFTVTTFADELAEIINILSETELVSTFEDSRLSDAQIEALLDHPKVGLLFFNPTQRQDIFYSVLQSNLSIDLADFSERLQVTSITSNQAIDLVTYIEGHYDDEMIHVRFNQQSATLALRSEADMSLEQSLQTQLNQQLGDKLVTVHLLDDGRLSFSSANITADDQLSLDMHQAVLFAQHSELPNQQVTSQLYNFNAHFTIQLTLGNGEIIRYPIQLDQTHHTIEDLIRDIENDLPNNALIMLASNGADLQFIAKATMEGTYISLNQFRGDSQALNQLKLSLGGIESGDLSATAVSHDQQDFNFGFIVSDKQQRPVFVAYNLYPTKTLNIDSLLAPDFVLKGNQDSPLIKEANLNNSGINWGYWIHTAQQPAQQLLSAVDLQQKNELDSPYYFAEFTPAEQQQLVGQKAFTMTGDFLAHSNLGDVVDVKGNMAVNFNNGAVNGHLDITTSTTEQTQNWHVDYLGQVNEAQVNMQQVWGELRQQSTVTYISGQMSGHFADPGTNYIGGFNLQTLDQKKDHVQGLYLMSETP